MGIPIVIILFTTLLAENILTSYARLFSMDNASKGADCILILSGNEQTRPDHAASLIRQGYSDKLFHTDQKQWMSKNSLILGHPFDKAQKILATYNLSADIIPSIKGGATSTFDEAYDFVVFLKTHPMKHVILVTDSFHTSRANYAFKKVMDLNGHRDLKIEMSPASNEIFNETNWWKSERGIASYILEPLKYLFYLFNNSNTTTIQED